ncbi:acylphosphatase [Pseudodesulfovibrio tunisiensis]|uniref:acylphosphatase n=1 Tax=Pseudodesulfovibrio tunisiensis TaxID=463192 RepID=UPI00311E7B83
MKQVRAIIRGKVQGVWFRGWTRDTARELGLRGWVRNLPDGAVEAVAPGKAGLPRPVSGAVAQRPASGARFRGRNPMGGTGFRFGHLPNTKVGIFHSPLAKFANGIIFSNLIQKRHFS